EIPELNLVFAHMRVAHPPRRLRCPQRGLGLVVLLLADRADAKQLLGPLELLLGVPHRGFLRGTTGLLALHGRLLFRRIDLEDRRSAPDRGAGTYEDLGDDALDLRAHLG